MESTETAEITLPLRLRQLRAERDWSLAKASEEVGINPDNLSHLEKGWSRPRVGTLNKISAAYGVPLEELLALQDIPSGKARAADKRLLGLEHVRGWLASEEVGAKLLLEEDETFLYRAAGCTSLEEFEHLVQDLVSERAKVEDALWGAKDDLFPQEPMPEGLSDEDRKSWAMRPGRNLQQLRREISTEYRARERAVIGVNRRMYEQGDVEGFLARGEVPKDVLRQLKNARRVLKRETLVSA
jgi:transcriptional regulator with XRE-family HTH domain